MTTPPDPSNDNNLIDAFVARYRREFDYFEQVARLVSQMLDGRLQSAGIRSMVTFRPKSPARVEAKVRQRSIAHLYTSVEDIYDDMVDLAGVRVALYFPAERVQVDRAIRDLFDVHFSKDFPDENRPELPYAKRFSGYSATHYRLRLRPSSLTEAQRRYADANVEIQVASVLMHAWAEVEHDLIYKPMQGTLAEDEYAILDELNGLVIAGEIALERLQRAGEQRVGAEGRPFENHFELAAYLLNRAAPLLTGPGSDAALGRIDLLFLLLKRLEMATSQDLDRYIDALNADVERRPFAEQIVDQLLEEDQSRYAVYDTIRASLDDDSVRPTGHRENDMGAVLGSFIDAWSDLEKLIRVRSRMPAGRPLVLNQKMLSSLELPTDLLHDLEYIRRVRNEVVHGMDRPSTEILRAMTERLESIAREIELKLG